MKQITLSIPDSRFDAFIQFIKSLSFIKIAPAEKSVSAPVKTRTFITAKTKDKNYKFNREEANER